MLKDIDPVTPSVRFDNYVIPETVRQGKDQWQPTIQPNTANTQPASTGFKVSGFQVTGLMAAVSGIAFLTFVLGIMVALKFSDAGNAAVAELPADNELQEVSRTATPDLTATPVAPVPVLPAAAAPSAIDADVLKSLQPLSRERSLTEEEITQRTLEAEAIVNRNKLRMLREGVLAGVYSVKEQEEDGIRRLVLTTVNAELSRKTMANLLLEAAQRGDAQIPASLSAASGGYDMDTTLFNLIQTSLMNDATPESTQAAREMSRRAFLASSAKTEMVNGQRHYTVRRGDSLASIALNFFGMPSAYLQIFEANKNTLASPDQLQTGRQLIIPLQK
ncbi:LysM domain protein [Sulfitobacter noctilucicola]|uniref:Nucleoid-associated protein YgaU n=1 Tax=Sulfitobacter noctilucicola TaxID=1342301 RepID=A0A7W6M517_9RHOB|nr:LysM peptidoglycan-binding domain-containing protein [Sulfitobacter noctilucicola]KIN63188.1 LysM domain protein [Sulfitobacter noctilucicola]MBB4172287.1 nucleoid-associated protein YgaU [Sulfitobacter noctilucicola]